jgi:hypothetical protein
MDNTCLGAADAYRFVLRHPSEYNSSILPHGSVARDFQYLNSELGQPRTQCPIQRSSCNDVSHIANQIRKQTYR